MRNPTSPNGGPPPGIKDPLTPGDVARLFNVDARTVTRWEAAGRLPGMFLTPGGHRRYPWATIRPLYLGQRGTGPRPGPMRPRRAADAPPPSATIQIGDRNPLSLELTPVPADVTTPGRVALILGWTSGGKPVTLTVTNLRWLDDLEFAAMNARAKGVLEAEMTEMATAAQS